MPVVFKKHKSRIGGKHLISDEPFAVIRESGEIYLSGDYTIEELRAILEASEQKIHPTLGESVASDNESNPAPKRVI